MATKLDDIEYSVSTLSQRVEQLVNERNVLRRELAKNSDGNLEHNKVFIQAYQDNIITRTSAAEKIYRLEYLLQLIIQNGRQNSK